MKYMYTHVALPGISCASGNTDSSDWYSSSLNSLASSGSLAISTTHLAASNGLQPIILDLMVQSKVLPYRSNIFWVAFVYRCSVSELKEEEVNYITA